MLGASLYACPRCAVGELARREFWQNDPAFYAGALLAPFVLTVLTVLLLLRPDQRP
jgi:hypothetical protein